MASLAPTPARSVAIRCVLLLLSLVALSTAAPTSSAAASASPAVRGSTWYDWAWYGPYPRLSYKSFGAVSPRPNLVRTDDRCDDGLTFIQPRGVYVGAPGPVILDNQGNLVWTHTQWGQAMDLKVQRFQGRDHITFWHGTDNGTFGEGYYLILDDSYQVVKKVVPVGDLTGDLHEFRITEDDTALMTIYEKIQVDMSGYGIARGWIYDSIFQEVDLVTGELLFEWRASEHFAADQTMALLGDQGRSPEKAFDYFHINSIDKDNAGDYMISSRYLCAVIGVSARDGRVLWQLGGDGNQFADLSGGQATDFTWNHHASWSDKDNTTLTVFDNGSNGPQVSAKHSRGLMVHVDLDAMTADLIHAYVAPQKLLATSQGSVQTLPNGNVLVGWGHTAAWTEYTLEGEVLCDTHIAPIWFANFGWAKNYRTFKFPWVGRPSIPPDVAMRPKENTLYASWNGATEVHSWQVQCGDHPDASDSAYEDNGPAIPKLTFETRLAVSRDAGPYVRAVALAADGSVLGHSASVSRTVRTVTDLLDAPSRGTPMEPATIFGLSLLGTVAGIAIIVFRGSLLRGAHRLLRRGYSTYRYQLLQPTR